ncbi:hypothetical protein ABVN80_00170 [Acinetobacter baumannii]
MGAFIFGIGWGIAGMVSSARFNSYWIRTFLKRFYFIVAMLVVNVYLPNFK